VDIKKAIDVVKTHNVDLQKLLTHEFLLAEAKKAFETADKKTGDPLKIGLRIRK
jgi:threonine dehydrogenase-like Zn-dependent dehydrogenase